MNMTHNDTVTKRYKVYLLKTAATEVFVHLVTHSINKCTHKLTSSSFGEATGLVSEKLSYWVKLLVERTLIVD